MQVIRNLLVNKYALYVCREVVFDSALSADTIMGGAGWWVSMWLIKLRVSLCPWTCLFVKW